VSIIPPCCRVWTKSKGLPHIDLVRKRLVSINASREVDAQLENVWDIVADVDNDPKYWSGLSSIQNKRREGNLIEREVRVGFMHSAASQRITLRPMESISLTMTKGPMIGSRVTTLSPLDNGKKTRIDISWNFKISSGIPSFAQSFMKGQIENGTKDALEKILNAAKKQRSNSISNSGSVAMRNSPTETMLGNVGSETRIAI
jgi:carbon monoxide dehydrogenase subunit G